MLGLDVIALFIFLAIVFIHIFLRRKKIEFEYGIILEYWSGGLDWMYKFSKKHNKFLKRIGDVSIVVGMMLSIVGLGFLFYSLAKLKPSLAFVLPSVGGYKYPGPVISVPFWYWIIVVFVIAFPHETFHAIFSATEGVKIRKYGVLYLFLLPVGAFVDPDKRQFKKLSVRSKLRIITAGSFANLLTSGIAFLLILLTGFLLSNFIHSDGVRFTSTIPDTPAYYANLTGVIKEINGTKISSIDDLASLLNKLKPNQTVIVKTSEGDYTIKLGEKDNRTIIGIQGVSNHYVFKNGNEVPSYVLGPIVYWEILLSWIFLFSLGVSVANMLPAKPLDGGLAFEEILKKYLGEKNGAKASNFLTLIIWILVFSSLVLPWLIQALRPF